MPLLSGEAELYSELPNLPEAPETAGFPETELPEPAVNGMDELELPEIKEEGQPANQSAKTKPILPYWPGPEAASHEKIPELPKLSAEDITEEKPENWLNIPADVPQLKLFGPEPEENPVTGRLVNQNNAFFLRAEDFRMARNSLDKIAKAQKKHHSLSDLKKEENAQYERINVLTEDAQRKLMRIDRTLFEN